MQSKVGNKAKGRRHSRHAGKRAAAKLRRNQRANQRKINRMKRIERAKGKSKKEHPSDLRRRQRRAKKFGKTE